MNNDTREAVLRAVKANLAADEATHASWYANEGYPSHLPPGLVNSMYWSIVDRKALLSLLQETERDLHGSQLSGTEWA